MTFNEFITKYNGKGLDWDGAYGFQCTDLYRYYCHEVLRVPQSPPVVGAKDIWNTYLKDHFTRIENTPEGVPQAGDVMIWGSQYGPYGHVAVVTSANVNSFTCFSQNDPVGTLCQLRNYKNYRGVLGWLHPNLNMSDQISIEKKVFEELVTKSSAYDRFKAMGFESAESLSVKLAELKKTAEEQSNAKREAEDLAEDYRRQLRDFVAVLADDAHLKTRQDIPEIEAKAALFGRIEGELEDTTTKYQKDFKSWAVTEAELQSEIARLKALLDYEEVLSNAKTQELIREIIRRLTKLIKK